MGSKTTCVIVVALNVLHMELDSDQNTSQICQFS